METIEILIGLKLLAVDRVEDADEGVVLRFEGGHVLRIGYSSCEGSMSFDGKEIEGDERWDDEL